MSLGTCIPGMIKRGEIDHARGKRMQELFDELERFYARSMGPEAAAAEASEATLRQLAADARLKKRQTLLQINRQRDAIADMGRFRGKDQYQAIRALLDDDDQAPYRGGNVSTAAQRIEYGMHARVQDFIERHRRNLLGRPNDAAGLDDVVRELHGQATGNERARVFAEGIGDAFEQLRQRFNQAGGNIGKIKGFGLPHRHDAIKVRAVSREQWISDILPELDRAQMIDEHTGAPMTDERLNAALSDVYETIRTNGLTGEASTAFTGPGKLANRRAEHRFLHFTDGDAWLRYDARYGAGDTPFTTIMGHISGMSKDIAMMERLGPNPDATVRYLLDHVDRREAQSDRKLVGAVMGVSPGRKMTEALWGYLKGTSNIPVMPENRWGYHAVRFVQGWRNLAVAKKLGSASISAFFGDAETGAVARRTYGLSAISDVNSGLMAHFFRHAPEVKVLEGYLKQLNPLDATHRDLAVRLGLGMHDAAQSMTSIARYYGESNGPGWTQVAADSVLRMSGLNKITEAGQNLFGIEVMRTLGAYREKAWGELPGELRTALEHAGLDKFDWTAIRQAEPILSGGAAHIDVSAVSDRGAADRLMNFVLRGRAAAVQESSARSRAYSTLGTNPGTLAGELLRNSLQFRGFSIALFLKQMSVLQSLGPYRGARYAARFFIGMTLAGAVTLQMREIVKGNDPLPMDSADFWEKAALQSGGIGIVSDLLAAVADPSIDSWGEFVAGPIGSDIKTVKQLAGTALPGRQVRQDGTRKPANPGGAAVRAVDQFTPGSNIWYLRSGWERMVIDQLRADIDPNSAQVLARRAKGLAKTRQAEWWKSGDLLPSRAPDFSNALGNEDQPQ